MLIDSHVHQKPYQSLALLQRQLYKLSSVGIFGVPSTITTDSGQQFESSLWQQLMRLLGSRRIRITAYHPIANALVERFHRQLKASLKCLSDPTHWVKALPMVLLGIRTALKQDLQCTAAELVYGTTLRLPGEYFHQHTNATLDPISYASQLKTLMQSLKPPPVRQQQQRNCYINEHLNNCHFVFVRHDAVKKPLQPPYDGPFRVLQRHNKHFTLDINGHKKVVSLDRLKPAFVEHTATVIDTPASQSQTPTATISPPTTDLPQRITRSGHHVHWPKRFASYKSFS